MCNSDKPVSIGVGRLLWGNQLAQGRPAKRLGNPSVSHQQTHVSRCLQAARGNELAQAQGLGDRVSFQVADALHQPFEDGQFDLVWSMESGEHMPDKAQFVGELARVCKPGGRIIMVTWCHRWVAWQSLTQGRGGASESGCCWVRGAAGGCTLRCRSCPTGASACRNLGPEEQALQADEEALLNQICKAYYLPRWCSINDYQRLMEAKGLQDIRTADWSEEVAPFWGAVIRSALSLEGFKGLFTAGLKTIKVGASGRFDIETLWRPVCVTSCGCSRLGLRPPRCAELPALQLRRNGGLQQRCGRL